jgi:hypothetical protein
MGEAGDGLFSAEMRSRAAAMAACDEDRNDMVTWFGNHASVSATLSALVPQIHTR